MNLAHVRQFIAVAETLHFGKASAQLGIPQPQLSRAVQSLEHSLRVRLLARTTRQITLTAAGRAFLVEARKLLAQADLARHLAQDAEAGGTVRLRIAFVAPALDFLPRALRQFRKAWPHVELLLERRSSEAQLAGLRDGSIDVALLSTAMRNTDGLEVRTVTRSRYTALAPSDWEIAQRDSVRLVELAALPFLRPPVEQDPQVHNAVLLACRSAGFEPRIVSGAAQAYAIEALVAAGEGITLQPEIWKAIRLEGVTHVAISDLPDYLVWELSVAWAPHPFGSPPLRTLVDILEGFGSSQDVEAPG